MALAKRAVLAELDRPAVVYLTAVSQRAKIDVDLEQGVSDGRVESAATS